MTKVHTDKLKEALNRYFMEKVAPSVNGSLAQFALGAGYVLWANNMDCRLKEWGLADEESKVDVDVLEKAVVGGFKAANNGKVSMSFLGSKFTFSTEDWKEFRRMLI